MIRRALIYSLLLTSISVQQAAKTAPLSQNSATAAIKVGDLIILQGVVQLKRKSWSAYRLQKAATFLLLGDSLKVERTSRALAVCDGDKRFEVKSGDQPCKAPEKIKAVYKIDGSQIGRMRSSGSINYPVILTPRKTKLLSSRPTLRWTPLSPRSEYLVTLRGPNFNWTRKVVGKTEFEYPADEKPLIPGETYKLTVVADGRSSDEEETPGLGFSLLDGVAEKSIRESEKSIRSLGLTPQATNSLLADLYASAGLNSEALELLALARSAGEPAVMRSMADLFFKSGLIREAEIAYIRASELAKTSDDLEGQALAERALGLIYQAFGNTGEATNRFRKAMDLYRRLGDSESVSELRNLLNK